MRRNRLITFKRMLANYYMISDYFLTFWLFTRYCSIIHSRLRLDTCALFYYLFNTAVLSSPVYSCGVDKEAKSHIFFTLSYICFSKEKTAFCCCSFFSNEWSRYSDSQKVNFFLFGSSQLSTEENVELFSYAQQFIKESKRFCFFLKGFIYSWCHMHVVCQVWV